VNGAEFAMGLDQIARTRAAAIYLPLMLALIAALMQRPGRRRLAGILLSFLWAAVGLLALERLNLWAGWWSFPADDGIGGGVSFAGIPTELYLGWVVLWGLVPQLALSQVRIPFSVAAMVAADLAAMPACWPVVRLGSRWLVGEAVAVMLVLIPAICIARWTEQDRHLKRRAAMQVATAAGLFLFLVPEMVFGVTFQGATGWSPLLRLHGWQLQALVGAMLLLALPGVSAAMEFAQRGGGTPIPYDPPKGLVTSGIYRYLANPMQLSCFLVMLLWAMLLGSAWLLAAAFMSIVYSAGVARWDEREDLRRRFGPEWVTYRAHVRDWAPGWRPYCAGPAATLYVAAGCPPCREVRRWIEARRPLGLAIVDAETLPQASIRRLRYQWSGPSGTSSVDGLRAMARALEHLDLRWALAGAALRLPGVWWAIQLVMDASGLGPRVVRCTSNSSC